MNSLGDISEYWEFEFVDDLFKHLQRSYMACSLINNILHYFDMFRFPISFRSVLILPWVSQLMQDFNHPDLMLRSFAGFHWTKYATCYLNIPSWSLLYSGKWKWSCGLVFGCLSVCLSVDGQNILWLTRGWKSCNCFTTFIFTLVWHSFLVTSFGMWPARPAWWNQDCLWGEERANNHRRRWFQMISTDFSFTKGTLGKWSNLTVRIFFVKPGGIY